MGLITNWKQGRAQRIAEAEARKGIANGTVVMNTGTVDPRAQVFLDYLSEVLTEHGVVEKQKIDQCCFDLHQITMREFRHALAAGGVAMGRMLEKMGKALGNAGVTDVVEQEEILLNYFAKLKEMGEA